MILMLFLSIPVSPVYINAPVLFNGKLLPTFVNHTIMSIDCVYFKFTDDLNELLVPGSA